MFYLHEQPVFTLDDSNDEVLPEEVSVGVSSIKKFVHWNFAFPKTKWAFALKNQTNWEIREKAIERLDIDENFRRPT